MSQIRKNLKAAYGNGRAIAIRQPGDTDEQNISGAQVYALNDANSWYWVGSFASCCASLGILTVRKDVESIEYHRPPTRGELNRGEGATHYTVFDIEECCYEGTRVAKQWFVSPYDGLRYYR